MKRSSVPRTPRILKLKRETVRQLGSIELARAAGGGQAVAFDTELVTCPWTTRVAAPTVVCGNG